MLKKLLFVGALMASVAGNAQVVDTLESHFYGPGSVLTATGGYTTGPNSYGDLGYYQRFDNTLGLTAPYSSLTSVLFDFTLVTGTSGNIVVKVVNMTNSQELASETVSIATLKAGVLTPFNGTNGTLYYNYTHTFATPIAVDANSDILVGFDLPTTAASGDSVVVNSSAASSFTKAAFTLVKESGGGYADWNAGWAEQRAFSIFPIVEGTSSISENELSNVSIYPNPAVSNVTFDLGEELEGSIKVLDVTGRVVNETLIDGVVNTVNVSEFNNGIYIYQIVSLGNVLKTGKFNVAK